MKNDNAENNEAQAVDNAAQEEKQTDNHLFTQEDVDRTVESRLARERKKYDKELDRRIAEYDRQAKLSEEEREAERRAQSERELAEKERQITLRENLFNAKNVLIEKGHIPRISRAGSRRRR
nr:MAG TPA: Major head protein [Caudoviricetes sp.]